MCSTTSRRCKGILSLFWPPTSFDWPFVRVVHGVRLEVANPPGVCNTLSNVLCTREFKPRSGLFFFVFLHAVPRCPARSSLSLPFTEAQSQSITIFQKMSLIGIRTVLQGRVPCRAVRGLAHRVELTVQV